jgi:hypothetical protein
MGEKMLKHQPYSVPDEEMERQVLKYVDYVRDIASIDNRRMLVEEHVDITSVIPDTFGHCDAVVLSTEGSEQPYLELVDLKYGQGIVVEAEYNTQLMMYALGIIDMYDLDLEEVRLTIVQPRAYHPHGPVRTSIMTLEELEDFKTQVQSAYTQALEPNPPYKPGEKQCKWCTAQPVCPHLRDFVYNTAAECFAPFTPKTLPVSLDELAAILPHVDLIKNWCGSVVAEAQQLLEQGHKVPGYKLVRGRSNRRWTNEKEALERLTQMNYVDDDIFTKKFISPTQAEKLVGKDSYQDISDLVFKPQGKITVAVESDPRQPVNPFEGFDQN